ncbi:MAG TPA: hypothetical protein EYO61_02445 [Campylobacterales bacterium]|nr:hypothetical protein [Campylobacterales bacterium]
MKRYLIFFLPLLLFGGIGVIKKIRNDVFVIRNGDTLETKPGFELLSNDIVVTGDKSKAKLVFQDKTKITLGKNSIFEIQKYLFDGTKKSRAKFKAKYGFFNAVTGKIGKVAPDNFALKTKTATIGVRGTEFEGVVSPSKEGVKCVKGTIAVSAKGKTIILNEGESLEITEELFNPKFIGEIKSIEGVAFVKDGKNIFVASVGHLLRPKEILVAGYDSKVVLELVDKAVVEVHKNSGFIGDFKNGKEKIDVLKGVITIKAKNGEKNFSQGNIVFLKDGKL